MKEHLSVLIESWAHDPDALDELLHNPEATARRFDLDNHELAMLLDADRLRSAGATGRAAASPPVAATISFETGSTITGGSSLTFETGSTITGGSALTFETGSTITGGSSLTFETGSTITGDPSPR